MYGRLCNMSTHAHRSYTGNDIVSFRAQQRYIKRLFDICFVAIALLFLIPLLLGLAVAVMITQGWPVLYRHQRLGLGGRHFPCLKFRSMVRNADAVLAKYLAENPEAAKEWAERVKLSNDPRITGFGRFLRRSSFDELPQLFNILMGDMSLVGPRPIMPEELVNYGENAGVLLSVRPGLTGLWQISGRSKLTITTQVALDIRYIQNWSFMEDMRIILKTIPVVLLQRGAV